MNAPRSREQYEKVLRSHLSRLADEEPLPGDMPLADLGLDSLTTVSLLIDLEAEFELTFPDEALTAQTFATATDLWVVLDSLVNRGDQAN